jgi:CRP-like cAMP-binding protein
MSPPLESAIRIYLYNESVLCSPYFSGKDTNYIVEIARALEDEIFLPGDYVIRNGEIAEGMYFVGRGELSVLVPSGGQKHVSFAEKVRSLAKGDYFGEIALVKDCVRTAWVKADSYVLLSKLQRRSVERIWAYFGLERQELVEAAIHKQANTKDRNASRANTRATTNASLASISSEDADNATLSGDTQPYQQRKEEEDTKRNQQRKETAYVFAADLDKDGIQDSDADSEVPDQINEDSKTSLRRVADPSDGSKSGGWEIDGSTTALLEGILSGQGRILKEIGCLGERQRLLETRLDHIASHSTSPFAESAAGCQATTSEIGSNSSAIGLEMKIPGVVTAVEDPRRSQPVTTLCSSLASATEEPP